MMKINLSENEYEDEIENIMKSNNMIDEDGMVYADHTIASIPFSSKQEVKNFVDENCVCFVDDNYIYVCMKDGLGDYAVQRCNIKKYSYLL